MDRNINWLHFTDLHYGQRGQNILWPKIKNELFKDLNYIKSELGKIHVVFFSGDLTQSGKKEEFDELTAVLKELWNYLNKLGSNPFLIAIPGNHDLCRPDQTKAVVKVLRNFNQDKDLKESFWDGLVEKNEYYELINNCFQNFSNWYHNVDLPKAQMCFGLLPGDISLSLEINSLSLGVIGLNSAFLELDGGDFFGKLAISPHQIMALTNNDPITWLKKSHINVLMTHHDPSWLNDEAKANYLNDINPIKTFHTHLCGHLHEANFWETGMIGEERRRLQLAPSLFGMQKINDQLDRIHGYFAGSYSVIDGSIYEKFYPRKAHKSYNGSYKIVPDNGFNLENKAFVETVSSASQESQFSQDDENKAKKKIIKINFQEADSSADNILTLESSDKPNLELDKIPRYQLTVSKRHEKIRIIQQGKFHENLQRDRFAWLFTDWGLDEGGFVASLAPQLHIDKSKNGYVLNCEDISNDNELVSAFDQQFTMPLQQFCNIVSKERNLLVFDHVSIALYSTSASLHKFLNLIKSIIDFCPELYIVIIGRQIPKTLSDEQYVKLSPLDASELRSYLSDFLPTLSELEGKDNLKKMLEITSGLPKHIDRFVESLKVASFEELVEAEKELTLEVVTVDKIPKSLKQAIHSLDDILDKGKQRSLQMLKILTILANGETIGNLKRFDGKNLLTVENANTLEQLSLIEIISSTRVLSKVYNSEAQQIKILRVPRQIRDYVITIITEDEKETIVKLGCDFYFGSKWRIGKVKDFYSSLFKSSKFLNIDNCHLLTNSLMATAIKENNDFEIERAANLASSFCDYLVDHDDFKNAANMSEEILNWLKSTSFRDLKAQFAKIYGNSLRMLGNSEKAVAVLNELLGDEDIKLSNAERNSILINLALDYVSNGDNDKALELSRKTQKKSDSDSVVYLQAKYIEFRATLTGHELIKRLKSLESIAKKKGWSQAVNTISLTIIQEENGSHSAQNDKRYSQIISSGGDDYNKIRAILGKIALQIDQNEPISNEDLHLLNVSYSYVYIQQMPGLFNKCHRLLWAYCVKNHRIIDLLNLFKHSSLVWRISGETELENKYFLELESIVSPNGFEEYNTNKINLANIEYFRRRSIEFSNDTNS